MSKTKDIRIFWLKLMYALTILIAGSLGIGMLLVPDATQWVFGVDCPRILSGLIGCVFLAFGVISVLGVRNPIKFVSLLFMQLLYKSAWLCFVAFPLLISGELTSDMIPVIVVFLAVVVGDVIAIPFHIIFKNTPE